MGFYRFVCSCFILDLFVMFTSFQSIIEICLVQ